MAARKTQRRGATVEQLLKVCPHPATHTHPLAHSQQLSTHTSLTETHVWQCWALNHTFTSSPCLWPQCWTLPPPQWTRCFQPFPRPPPDCTAVTGLPQSHCVLRQRETLAWDYTLAAVCTWTRRMWFRYYASQYHHPAPVTDGELTESDG